jgi:hypothetical protein
VKRGKAGTKGREKMMGGREEPGRSETRGNNFKNSSDFLPRQVCSTASGGWTPLLSGRE